MKFTLGILALSFIVANANIDDDEYNTIIEGVLKGIAGFPRNTSRDFYDQIDSKIFSHMQMYNLVQKILNMYLEEKASCVIINIEKVNTAFGEFNKNMKLCENVAVNATDEIIADIRVLSQTMEKNMKDLRSHKKPNTKNLNTLVKSHMQSVSESLEDIKRSAETIFRPILAQADCCGGKVAETLVSSTIPLCVK